MPLSFLSRNSTQAVTNFNVSSNQNIGPLLGLANFMVPLIEFSALMLTSTVISLNTTVLRPGVKYLRNTTRDLTKVQRNRTNNTSPLGSPIDYFNNKFDALGNKFGDAYDALNDRLFGWALGLPGIWSFIMAVLISFANLISFTIFLTVWLFFEYIAASLLANVIYSVLCLIWSVFCFCINSCILCIQRVEDRRYVRWRRAQLEIQRQQRIAQQEARLQAEANAPARYRNFGEYHYRALWWTIAGPALLQRRAAILRRGHLMVLQREIGPNRIRLTLPIVRRIVQYSAEIAPFIRPNQNRGLRIRHHLPEWMQNRNFVGVIRAYNPLMLRNLVIDWRGDRGYNSDDSPVQIRNFNPEPGFESDPE